MSRALCIMLAFLLVSKKAKVKRCPTINKSAPFGLSLTILIALLAGCAAGDASRTRPVAQTRPVAPPLVYAPDEVTYENRWVNGINVVIATAGDMRIVAAVWTDPLHALILLVNGTNDPITFQPQEVVMVAIQTDAHETQRSYLSTYSAEEYEKKVRPAEGWDTALSILAARDYPAVSTMIQNKTRAKSDAFQAMTATLMRTHTLDPQSYYGGMVYFENRKAKQYQLYVPFGPKSFTFTFNLK